MSIKIARIVGWLVVLLTVAVMAHAGGVDPREMSAQEPVVREQIIATPEQTSTAVSKARRAVTPAVEEVPVVKPTPVVKTAPVRKSQPKAVTSASKDSWLLGSREGECSALSSVDRKVKVGSFKTPQEFAHKLQQRGYQAFVLDVGDVRNQMIRVKVPDLDLDLIFMRAGLCR